eukprot:4701679-Amphidinium_carterae.1
MASRQVQWETLPRGWTNPAMQPIRLNNAGTLSQKTDQGAACAHTHTHTWCFVLATVAPATTSPSSQSSGRCCSQLYLCTTVLREPTSPDKSTAGGACCSLIRPSNCSAYRGVRKKAHGAAVFITAQCHKHNGTSYSAALPCAGVLQHARHSNGEMVTLQKAPRNQDCSIDCVSSIAFLEVWHHKTPKTAMLHCSQSYPKVQTASDNANAICKH